MSVAFGSSFTVRNYAWTAWKAFFISKGLLPQWDEDTELYTIWGYDGPEVFSCTIYKGSVPDGVLPVYSQAQNDTDKTDFETNFKPYSNRPLDDAPSQIIAGLLRTGGGSANLGVDGSVTPVVFSASPPAGYDVEVTALSLLFEDSTAVNFGNKFVYNAINTLANGLLLEAKIGDVVISPWQNMKRTRDLIEICEDFNIVTGTPAFVRIRVKLPPYMRLAREGTFAQPDYVRLTVRDNLAALDFAEAHFLGVKL